MPKYCYLVNVPKNTSKNIKNTHHPNRPNPKKTEKQTNKQNQTKTNQTKTKPKQNITQTKTKNTTKTNTKQNKTYQNKPNQNQTQTKTQNQIKPKSRVPIITTSKPGRSCINKLGAKRIKATTTMSAVVSVRWCRLRAVKSHEKVRQKTRGREGHHGNPYAKAPGEEGIHLSHTKTLLVSIILVV